MNTNFLKDGEITLTEALNCYNELVEALDKDEEEWLDELLTKLGFDYFSANTEEKCLFDNWKDAKNKLIFSKGFVGLAEESGELLHIVYSSLNLILATSQKGETGYLQAFTYKGQRFYVSNESGEMIMFYLPEEY